MKNFSMDISTLIIRAIQAYPCSADMEGFTFALEYHSFCITYWIISQGKFQPTILSTQPDFKISGSLPQWMELLYNPLSPLGGCAIQGDPSKLQSLKENLTHLALMYRETWDNQPFLRSLFHKVAILITKILPDSPWAERSEHESMGIRLKDMYQRLDSIQWAIKKIESPQ